MQKRSIRFKDCTFPDWFGHRTAA